MCNTESISIKTEEELKTLHSKNIMYLYILNHDVPQP